jgi:hypothetical protein
VVGFGEWLFLALPNAFRESADQVVGDRSASSYLIDGAVELLKALLEVTDTVPEDFRLKSL